MDASDDTKDNIHEELERVFDQFPMYHVTILLLDFNAKEGMRNVGRLHRHFV